MLQSLMDITTHPTVNITPSHTIIYQVAKNEIKEVFPKRWILLAGYLEWSPCLPDLYLLDFIFCP